MASERKDSKGRALYQGEYERPDGKYKFAYTENGKRLYLYPVDILVGIVVGAGLRLAVYLQDTTWTRCIFF